MINSPTGVPESPVMNSSASAMLLDEDACLDLPKN